jgi:plastocyanin
MKAIKKPRRRGLLAAVPLAALMLVAACGSDTPEAQPAEAETIVVAAHDYAFTGLPETIAAGSTLALHNESTAEVHELVAIRLPDDETRSVADLVQLPPEEMAAFFPLVETVLVAPPGEDGIAVEGTGTLSEPGRYAVICVIPTGADPEEYMTAAAEAEGGPPEVAGGPPHIVHGMFAEFTVEG